MAPSTLTAMRWDDLSISTSTPARAGVSARPKVIAAAASTSLASRPPDSRFMTLAPARFLLQA
jgi:hypothetical protein